MDSTDRSFRQSLRWVVALALVAASLLLPSSPVSAHGTCTVTARVPVPSLTVVVYGGEMACSDVHADLYVRACLQYSVSAVGPWATVECTSTAHAESARHVSVSDTAGACVLGFYRSMAEGWNTSLYHWDLQHSAPSACINAN